MTSVITGDIINSRNTPSSEWLPLLKMVFNTIGETPKTWEIYRGDSFQIEISNVESTLLVAIKLKTILKEIKNLDVRIAIGIGNKDTYYDRITEGSGEAFINSGDAFDTMLKKQNLAIISPWEEINTIFNTSFALALLTMDNWTVNSAAFVAKYLKKPNTKNLEPHYKEHVKSINNLTTISYLKSLQKTLSQPTFPLSHCTTQI